MRGEFQNLKIAITNEVHLKAVCDVLESMGYKKAGSFNRYSWASEIICCEFGLYCARAHPHNCADLYKQATLTDLLKMRDEAFKEKLK